jgi:hypothetical protein
MSRSSKGASFERWVCKRLSMWWSDGEDDSLFWRTSQSGGRATTRRKKGLKTVGHCGDICSTDPSSAPFTKLFAVEVKRGYAKVSFADMLDRPPKRKRTQFEEWITQAETARENAGAWSWMLITRRDSFLPLVFLPTRQLDFIYHCVAEHTVQMICGDVEITGFRLEDFLEGLDRRDVEDKVEDLAA